MTSIFKALILTTILGLFCTLSAISQPTYSGMGYYMDQKAQQYDAAFKKIQSEYNDLLELRLINKVNKIWLERYRAQVKDWADKNFSKYDLSIPANADKIEKYFNDWYNNEYIRDEISLIRTVKIEMSRLKTKDPDGFYKSERYIEMNKIFSELEDCQPQEINKIALKHGLLE